MLYDEKPRLHPARKMLLLLIPILSVAVAYAVYDYLGASRVGSSSKLGEVYSTRFAGHKGYVWCLRDRNGNVLTHGMSDDKPYIFEKGDTVSITFSERGFGLDNEYYTETYDLTQNPAAVLDEPAERPLLDLLTYTGHRRFPDVDTGSAYIPVKDITLNGHTLYHWGMQGENGELEWSQGSKTIPEVVSDGQEIEVYYTGYADSFYATDADGQAYLMYFEPESGWCSHDYALFEDGRVKVEQAMGSYSFHNILYYDGKTDGFVNDGPVEDPDNFYGCIPVYERAKAEVTKPYDLVTFRIDLTMGTNPEILSYEVTFADEETDDRTIVYLTADGETLLVLDGVPHDISQDSE